MLCTKIINIRIVMAKEGFIRKSTLLCGSLNKDLRKMLAKCCVWCAAIHGAETLTLREEDERRI